MSNNPWVCPGCQRGVAAWVNFCKHDEDASAAKAAQPLPYVGPGGTQIFVPQPNTWIGPVPDGNYMTQGTTVSVTPISAGACTISATNPESHNSVRITRRRIAS